MLRCPHCGTLVPNPFGFATVIDCFAPANCPGCGRFLNVADQSMDSDGQLRSTEHGPALWLQGGVAYVQTFVEELAEAAATNSEPDFIRLLKRIKGDAAAPAWLKAACFALLEIRAADRKTRTIVLCAIMIFVVYQYLSPTPEPQKPATTINITNTYNTYIQEQPANKGFRDYLKDIQDMIGKLGDIFRDSK